MKTKAADTGTRKTGVVEREQTPTVSLAGLPFTTPEQMQGRGFPYDVPTDLSEDEGREVERIMARGAPEWVRRLRDRLAR